MKSGAGYLFLPHYDQIRATQAYDRAIAAIARTNGYKHTATGTFIQHINRVSIIAVARSSAAA